MHNGMLLFSEMQCNGIRVDVDYCERVSAHLDRRIAYTESELLKYPEIRTWRNHYGSRFKLNSSQQLQWLLYTHMKVEPPKIVKHSDDEDPDDANPSTDKEALTKINLPFLRHLLAYRALTKARKTYMGNIMAEFAGVLASSQLFGVSRYIAVPLSAVFVWVLALKGNYKSVEKVFLFACFFYVSYVIAGFLSQPRWEEVAREVVAPPP
jgi:hypothetical protein